MDYQINPITVQTNYKCQPLRKQSFKGLSADDNVAYQNSSRISLRESIKFAWKNLQDVFPLLNPFEAFEAVMFEQNLAKNQKIKKMNYVA
jgi:hypothetical protein